MKSAPVIAALCLTTAADAFQQAAHPLPILPRFKNNRARARGMKSSTTVESDGLRASTRRRFGPAPKKTPYKRYNERSPTTSLSVASLDGVEILPGSSEQASLTQLKPNLPKSINLDAVCQVLSASLLITGNTVGTSMFVLPEAVGGVGMMTGSAIFLGLYVYNLISGLVLADVAISLHESSDCEVPSSFKDFVDTAMKSEVAGTIMAGASLISNSCFLAFGTVHAGSLLANTFPGLGMDPIVGAGGFAAMVALFSVTQTNKGLESIANAAVFVLFASFASVLLPSMAHIDPIETFRAPAVNHDGFAAAAATAVPLLLSSLTYQNIVPSIAKLLDFDRTKTTLAIAIGSFVPMVMYEAWCLAVLGGGLDNSAASGAGAAAFVAFSASALVGSSVAAVMSLAEEYESILTKVVDQDESCPLKNKFSVPAVALSMAPPVALALAYSNGGDLTCALHFNGAFITPFLYGLLPVLLHQRVTETEEVDGISLSSLPQVLLGAGAIGALGQAVVQDVSNIIA